MVNFSCDFRQVATYNESAGKGGLPPDAVEIFGSPFKEDVDREASLVWSMVSSMSKLDPLPAGQARLVTFEFWPKAHKSCDTLPPSSYLNGVSVEHNLSVLGSSEGAPLSKRASK